MSSKPKLDVPMILSRSEIEIGEDYLLIVKNPIRDIYKLARGASAPFFLIESVLGSPINIDDCLEIYKLPSIWRKV